MGGPRNSPVNATMGDWMRDQEKRTLREERRPRVTHASDLMGPGLAPFAVEVGDWNSDECLFNGFFYSEIGAGNAPNGTDMFIGMVIATKTGHGLQQVWDHPETGAPVHWVRTFHTHSFGTPVFSIWTVA